MTDDKWQNCRKYEFHIIIDNALKLQAENVEKYKKAMYVLVVGFK